ncbi:hypothetical protein IPM09_01670 [Candidatus Saccharibacteria bacterium]|nr:MAG: hypothetical protein IPM09_01670 [Candidatus Saccharibacteria bacterium]
MLNNIKVWSRAHAEKLALALVVGFALYGAINTYTDVQVWHQDPQWQSFSDTAGRAVWGFYLMVWVGYVAPPLLIMMFLLAITMVVVAVGILLEPRGPKGRVTSTSPIAKD